MGKAWLLNLSACFALLGAQLASAEKLPSAADYTAKLQVRIPMRDGVRLNATLYLPQPSKGGGEHKTPVIVIATPYMADSAHNFAAYFAAHDYVFAAVDVRGRGNSGGTFEPWIHEAEDNYDAVEWLARQPFCDGHVGMWGGSYAGFDQWATAKELPPHLATIAPAAAACPGIDVPDYNGIGQPHLVRWLSLTNGKTAQAQLYEDSDFWAAKFFSAYQHHIPFNSLDAYLGNPFPTFQLLIRHPAYDSYYRSLTPTARQYEKISIPILTITGQYDEEEFGALTYYREHFQHGNHDALLKHYLVIGPWDHAGTRVPEDEVGGVKFGPASLLDLKDLHRQWYDWTMKNGPKPSFLKKQVAYYLLPAGNTGANGEWEYADSLSALTNKGTTYYLDSKDGDGNGLAHAGMLTRQHPVQGSDSYTYDPLELHRGELVDMKSNDATELVDQTYARSIGKDGLIYQTEALPNETPVVGCPSLKLWLSLDTPDTDLEAYLYEMEPDGTSIRLWSHTCRLRYRESLSKGKLVRPGEIVACDLAPGLFVARRLMKGSRLRLVVSSPNTIWAEKNYNSGGVVSEETAKDARTAHVRIYHDAEHASILQLPLEQE
jgi:hypothetical protein